MGAPQRHRAAPRLVLRLLRLGRHDGARRGIGPGAQLCRRILVTSCHLDPVPALVPVIAHMVEGGVLVGDVLCDSGYAHRVPEHWALPLRALGAKLVMDLHPHDRGT